MPETKTKEVIVEVRFNLLKRMIDLLNKILDFLRETRVELAKVVWPSRAQTIQLTVVVILVTLAVGFFLGGIDLGLTKLTQFLIK